MGIKRVITGMALVLSVAAFGMTTPAFAEEGSKDGLKLKAGVVYMTRSGDDDHILATNSFAPGGATLINSEEVELGWEPGLDIAACYRKGAFAGDVRYLGLEWNEGSDPGQSAGGIVLQHPNPVGNTGFPAVFNATYMSELHSAELNFSWFPIDMLAVSIGPRWVLIDEELRVGLSIGPGLNVVSDMTKAENELIGGQIGVKANITLLDKLGLCAWGKVGYFSNEIYVSGSGSQSVGGTWASSAHGYDDTLLGEAGLNVKYQIIDHLSLVAGYQALWINKAAIATEQFATVDAFFGNAYITTDNVLYHGANASVVLDW